MHCSLPRGAVVIATEMHPFTEACGFSPMVGLLCPPIGQLFRIRMAGRRPIPVEGTPVETLKPERPSKWPHQFLSRIRPWPRIQHGLSAHSKRDAATQRAPSDDLDPAGQRHRLSLVATPRATTASPQGNAASDQARRGRLAGARLAAILL